MKKLLIKDLLKKSFKDLVSIRNIERKSLYELKLKNAIRSLNQTHLIKTAKKNVARINTIIRQKTLAVK